MGQKINPIGFRLGIFRKWKNNWFLEKKKYTEFLHLNFEISKYFRGILRNNNIRTLLVDCIISKISLLKIYIFILFYRLRRKRNRFKIKKKHKGKKHILIRPRMDLNYLRLEQAKFFKSKNLNLPRFYPMLGDLKKNFIEHLKQKNEIPEEFDEIRRENQIQLDKLVNNNLKLFWILQRNLFKNDIGGFSIKMQNYYLNKYLTPWNNNVCLINKKIKTYKLFRVKKLIMRRKYISIDRIKTSLETLITSKICLVLVNSISFLRYHDKLEKPNHLYTNFSQLEQRLVQRYKSGLRLAKDSMYVIFIALLLKKADFLSRFLGYQLTRMPKNRKQTKLVYFLKNLIKYSLIRNKDVRGIRIQFSGRINGRPRSKNVILNEGSLPLQTQKLSVEYGESFGITRYGTIGVKVWIHYNKKNKTQLINSFYTYFLRKIKKEIINVKTE